MAIPTGIMQKSKIMQWFFCCSFQKCVWIISCLACFNKQSKQSNNDFGFTLWCVCNDANHQQHCHRIITALSLSRNDGKWCSDNDVVVVFVVFVFPLPVLEKQIILLKQVVAHTMLQLATCTWWLWICTIISTGSPQCSFWWQCRQRCFLHRSCHCQKRRCRSSCDVMTCVMSFVMLDETILMGDRQTSSACFNADSHAEKHPLPCSFSALVPRGFGLLSPSWCA